MTDADVQRSSGATILGGIDTAGGEHCESTALRVLLRSAGLELSEAMVFGLGSGLSFIYWDSKRQQLPFFGGRVKPFALTQNLSSRLDLHLQVHETTSSARAWEHVRTQIDRGVPVGLQLDSHDLEYFGSRVHFAGHVVAMYGYDDSTAYLVDTAQQGGAVTTSRESLAAARAARGPMSARQRSFTIEVRDHAAVAERLDGAVLAAISACAESYLHPPIANVGHRGVRTAARRLPAVFARLDRPREDLQTIAMLMGRAGTGGALFRNLYREFLTDSLALLGNAEAIDIVTSGRVLIAESAQLWTHAAQLIARAGAEMDPELLVEASRLLEQIADIETRACSELRAVGPLSAR